MEDILVGSRSLSSFSSSRKLVSKRNPRLCLVPVFFNLTVDLIGLFFRLSVSFFLLRPIQNSENFCKDADGRKKWEKLIGRV